MQSESTACPNLLCHFFSHTALWNWWRNYDISISLGAFTLCGALGHFQINFCVSQEGSAIIPFSHEKELISSPRPQVEVSREAPSPKIPSCLLSTLGFQGRYVRPWAWYLRWKEKVTSLGVYWPEQPVSPLKSRTDSRSGIPREKAGDSCYLVLWSIEHPVWRQRSHCHPLEDSMLLPDFPLGNQRCGTVNV